MAAPSSTGANVPKSQQDVPQAQSFMMATADVPDIVKKAEEYRTLMSRAVSDPGRLDDLVVDYVRSLLPQGASATSSSTPMTSVEYVPPAHVKSSKIPEFLKPKEEQETHHPQRNVPVQRIERPRYQDEPQGKGKDEPKGKGKRKYSDEGQGTRWPEPRTQGKGKRGKNFATQGDRGEVLIGQLLRENQEFLDVATRQIRNELHLTPHDYARQWFPNFETTLLLMKARYSKVMKRDPNEVTPGAPEELVTNRLDDENLDRIRQEWIHCIFRQLLLLRRGIFRDARYDEYEEAFDVSHSGHLLHPMKRFTLWEKPGKPRPSNECRIHDCQRLGLTYDAQTRPSYQDDDDTQKDYRRTRDPDMVWPPQNLRIPNELYKHRYSTEKNQCYVCEGWNHHGFKCPFLWAYFHSEEGEEALRTQGIEMPREAFVRTHPHWDILENGLKNEWPLREACIISRRIHDRELPEDYWIDQGNYVTKTEFARTLGFPPGWETQPESELQERARVFTETRQVPQARTQVTTAVPKPKARAPRFTDEGTPVYTHTHPPKAPPADMSPSGMVTLPTSSSTPVFETPMVAPSSPVIDTPVVASSTHVVETPAEPRPPSGINVPIPDSGSSVNDQDSLNSARSVRSHGLNSME